jgi:hypothetical protein
MLVISMSVLGATVSPKNAMAVSENANVTSFTIKVAGVDEAGKTYTKESLENETVNGRAVLNTGTLPAEFKTKKDPANPWHIMQVKDYITLTDLIEVAEYSSYWKSGAEIEFKVMNEDTTTGAFEEQTYTGYTLTYEDSISQNKFYPYLQYDGTLYRGLDTSNECPAVIGFSRAELPITGQASSTLNKFSASDYKTTTQFVMGLSEVPTSTSTNIGGNRFPTSITEIVIYPNGK